MSDTMVRDFSNPGMPRVGTRANTSGAQDCPNAAAGLDRSNYAPCGCYGCAMRNRSIWVRVADRQSLPVMDLQTKVRYGVESRFGRVEDVNRAWGPNSKPLSMNFIVRFVSEDSVSQALAHGGGRIEEKGIKINISAMFRSKWVLLPSAFQVGHPIGSQDSIYRVFKAPSQRRGDLPLAQDFFMAGGDPSMQRTPTGGSFMYNNRPFGPIESRNFGQGGPYPGKKARFHMNTDGSSHSQQPFHAFHPHAQFHGLHTEATNLQNAPSMPGTDPQTQAMAHAQLELPLQPAAAAGEAVGEAEGAIQSVAPPQESATGKENTKPRVSLPEKPATTVATTPEQCQPQYAADQTVFDPALVSLRADKSPARQSKKKRQAAQLRAGNFESTGPTTADSGPPLVSSAAATATNTAQPPAKEKEAHRSSLFTADEIRDRKQAWDRIAVPLSSPRKHSLPAEDASLSARLGHDRAKSLPMATLAPPTKVDISADNKSTASAQKDAPVPKLAEPDGRLGSDAAGHAAGEDRALSVPSSSSPKKFGKLGRKKKTKQDSQSKLPAKKEHKL